MKAKNLAYQRYTRLFAFYRGFFLAPSGAENGTRTRDLNLGKVALYQLSYFRIARLRVQR